MFGKVRKLLENQGDNYIFPFLWMHGEGEEVLRNYMRVIYDANIRAVCVESRPHPDFCGPGWWKDMDIILEEARSLGMKVWILDDSHFPTGYANGAVEIAPDALCRQSLVYQIIECPEEGQLLTIDFKQYRKAAPWTPNMIETYQLPEDKMRHYEDDRIISVAAVKAGGETERDIIDLSGKAKDGQIEFTVPDGTWKVYVCQLTRNRGPHRSYINMMDEESCRLLIDAVYEPHYQRYHADFGSTIAGFFSDEPELGNGHLYDMGKRIYELDDQAWSAPLQDTLEQKWQGNFNRYLPLLWEQDFGEKLKAKVRYDYMDAVTRKVEECFSNQIGNWCREHGVSYIGHLIEDNNQHTRTGSSLGHYFRGLAGQDMAGIDDIGGQVLPQGEWVGPYGLMGEMRDGAFYHYVLGKLGVSLAAVDSLKKGRCMCEIFGNYGWEEGVKLEKYLADHFLVRGVNHFVPHAFSPKEFPDPDCPPHFYAHGNHPQYRHFGALMQYMNRVCELISGGMHIAPVAILYNAEAEWSGEYRNLSEPAVRLYDRQIDYDLIPEDVFSEPGKFGTQIGKRLSVNRQNYSVLLISGSQFITKASLKAIQRLQEAGCLVWFLERTPEGACDDPDFIWEFTERAKVVGLDHLVEELDRAKIPEIYPEPADQRLRCLHYVHREEQKDGQGKMAERREDRADIYLFVNEGTDIYRGSVRVPSTGACYIYDAWNNRVGRIDSRAVADGTVIALEVIPGRSVIVIFDGTDTILPLSMTEINQNVDGMKRERWDAGWKRSVCTAIEYPAFQEECDMALPDMLAEEKPEFSGFVRYEKKFFCEKSPRRMLLEIEDAWEGVEVFVNGISAGIQITSPYRYDVTELIKDGKNQIQIEVATTLERAMSGQSDPVREYLGLGKKVPVCKSGITGSVWRMEEEG